MASNSDSKPVLICSALFLTRLSWLTAGFALLSRVVSLEVTHALAFISTQRWQQSKQNTLIEMRINVLHIVCVAVVSYVSNRLPAVSTINKASCSRLRIPVFLDLCRIKIFNVTNALDSNPTFELHWFYSFATKSRNRQIPRLCFARMNRYQATTETDLRTVRVSVPVPFRYNDR